MILKIANIISFLPLLIFIIEFIIIIKKYLLKQPFLNNLIYYYGLILSPSIAQVLKYIIPYPKWMHKYTMRPDGARDCNYLSNNGLRAKNSPAMPSGHMTTTSYFVIYNSLSYIKQNKLINIIPYILLLIGMGWSRIYKLCHNLIQVIFGIILGSIIGLLFFYFN